MATTKAPASPPGVSPAAVGAVPTAAASRGIAVMLLAMFLFAAMDSTNKYLSDRYPIVEIVWVRFIFFAGFALVVARPRRVPTLLRSKAPWLQSARALLLIFEIATFVLALHYLPIADVHALAAISPLLVTVLAVPLLGERVGWRRAGAIGVGFAGVLLIVRPGFAIFDARLLLPLLGALLFAVYQILLRLVARYDSPPTTLLYSAFVGAGALSLIGPFDFIVPDAAGWALLLLSACLGAGAHFALIRAFDYAPASRLQPYGYTMMLWAAVFGVVVFGQFPDAWTVLGAVLICAGGLYAYYRERDEAG